MATKIAEFAKQQSEYNDSLENALANLAGDVKSLNDTITKLQGTPGVVTDEDQVLLDKASARSKRLVEKFDALDALTPPAVPKE